MTFLRIASVAVIVLSVLKPSAASEDVESGRLVHDASTFFAINDVDRVEISLVAWQATSRAPLTADDVRSRPELHMVVSDSTFAYHVFDELRKSVFKCSVEGALAKEMDIRFVLDAEFRGARVTYISDGSVLLTSSGVFVGCVNEDFRRFSALGFSALPEGH